MKEKIQVCKRNENSSLTVIIEDKMLPVELDESTMTLYATYNKQRYEVLGAFHLQYIVI